MTAPALAPPLKAPERRSPEGAAHPTQWVREGDLVALGRHWLLCGDAYNLTDQARLLEAHPTGKPCLGHYDPPYPRVKIFCGEKSRFERLGYRRFEGETQEFHPEQFRQLTWWSVFWGGNHYADQLPPRSGWLYWQKRLESKKLTMADGELAWTNKPGPLRAIRHMWDGWHRDSERGEKRIHPTQKPIAVIEWALDQFEGVKTVFDPFAGSGSTILACENTGRTCYAIELDPVMCDAIIRRWYEKTGIPPIVMKSFGGVL